MFLEKFQKIILDLYVKNEKLFVGAQLLKLKELQKIEEVLQIIMGQKISTSKDEEELSPEEKRMLELEEKIKAKKQKQEEEEGKTEQDANTIEDIMIAVIYEFGFDLEKIMNMNYFTLIWFYSYTSKLHVYRINQFAIGSGMVKKINSDYFTSLK
jgi:ATP phosphoribosyltransferase regulatory subunit HisZ